MRVRVHIISDMEGVSGIVKGEQTTGGDPMYEEARKLYTEEINAAVRGAKAGGATEIVVMHAKAGTQLGNMNHTVSGRDYQTLWFNGVEVGETGINAALCGTWGCPVLLVTGDEASCDEGTALLGDGLTTVAVKRAFASGAARQLPPVRARRLIEEGARDALADLKAVPPYDPGSPCEVKVAFKRTEPADRLRFHPGVERLDGRTIRVEAPTWWEAWKLFFFET